MSDYFYSNSINYWHMEGVVVSLLLPDPMGIFLVLTVYTSVRIGCLGYAWYVGTQIEDAEVNLERGRYALQEIQAAIAIPEERRADQLETMQNVNRILNNMIRYDQDRVSALEERQDWLISFAGKLPSVPVPIFFLFTMFLILILDYLYFMYYGKPLIFKWKTWI